ncbi:MAG: threonine--tRNA ligase, partial [Candidatus Pacebacteria bacterium]|nr:threonine--tRNA ligase [Candidatus Paceibacterota bacterium]
WGFYNDSMYPPIELGQTLEDYQDKRPAKETEIYLLKPMNCPFHMAIYNDDLHSYRNLPLKYYEFGTVYRYEQKGELGGLTRVRGFTQDDAHIFCTKEQLEDELKNIIDFAFFVLKDTFDFDIAIYASLRDSKNKDKYLGTDEDWNIAERTIKEILEKKGIEYIEEEGEAAFYGPKMDFKVRDSLGREHQLSTIQVDFNLPERFDMHYKNAEGKDVRPFIIHRALLGSLERFMGILIEHYAGAFPLWLSPLQVRVLPIADVHKEYAREIFETLKTAGIRIEIDDTNETLGKKIRNSKLEKIPYFLVIGDKEVESKTVTVESRDRGNEGALSIEDLLQKLQKEIAEKQKQKTEKK